MSRFLHRCKDEQNEQNFLSTLFFSVTLTRAVAHEVKVRVDSFYSVHILSKMNSWGPGVFQLRFVYNEQVVHFYLPVSKGKNCIIERHEM